MERLTVREKEVLRLVAGGLSCRRIAHCLGIAEYTVRKHRANLCNKLDCHSAAQLTALAIRDHLPAEASMPGSSSAIEHLRPRERQVVQFLAAGMTSKEIARVLGGISPRTVQKHREHAMRKLGVHDMTALMRFSAAMNDHEKDKT